jgi:myo-inositol 2-dehydrogenase / D-chiro-inositol 1-dehydrogenase
MSLKICMIGCGSFAWQCHGPAQRKHGELNPEIVLAACCDTEIDRSRAYGNAFGFERHYSEISKMLSVEKPDAVVLAVPPSATCDAASQVLELGFPLLLEKPPGISPRELGRLIAAAEKSGANAQVAFNRRYMPVMRAARQILDSAFHPDSVVRIDYEMVRFDRWDPDFSTTAVHALDAALFLARSPFRSADIRFQSQNNGKLESANVLVEAECACGTRVLVNILPVSGTNTESARIRAVGQSLSLAIPVSPSSQGDGSVQHWRSDKLVSSFSDRDVGAVDRLGVFGETGAFLDAVRSGVPCTPCLQDCHQQVALMEAIRMRRPGPLHFEVP